MKKNLLNRSLIALTTCTVILLFGCTKKDTCTKTTWYPDRDKDGLGIQGEAHKSCEQPDGYVSNSDDTDDSRNDINEERALALINAFNTGDPAPLEYVSDEKYIQHNPWFKDGKEALAKIFNGTPIANVKTIRTFSERDVVIMHNEFGEETVFDIFRFENGLIVEHWDNFEYTKIDGDGTSQTDGHTMVEKTSTYYKPFFEAMSQQLFITGDWTNAAKYFNFENFIEHRNGAGADGGYFSRFNGKTNLKFYNAVKFIYSYANFGLIMSEGPDYTGADTEGLYAYYDLFRVENGRMVEHWDVVQKIPVESQNNNGKW